MCTAQSVPSTLVRCTCLPFGARVSHINPWKRLCVRAVCADAIVCACLSPTVLSTCSLFAHRCLVDIKNIVFVDIKAIATLCLRLLLHILGRPHHPRAAAVCMSFHALQTAALMVLQWQQRWAGLALFAPCVAAHMNIVTR